MLKIDYNSIPRHTNEAANRRIEVATAIFFLNILIAVEINRRYRNKPGYPQY